ncbi:MAG: NADPH-dependent glutamate synthase [Dehalococcoidia bacterium]
MAKLNLNRVPMNKQEPEIRRWNPYEVALGYSYEQAVEEANRCIQCKKPGCINGCPVNVDIPGFVGALAQGNLPQAAQVLWKHNSLPAICGRVCPQETQCESQCSLANKGAPVAIGRLERFVADWARANPEESGVFKPELPKSTGKKVAILGSGPAGLTCAADLAKSGHQVTVFEALHLAGGVCVYGIPEFRLPKSIVQAEANYLQDTLGVDFQLNHVMGRIANVDELLKDGHDAVFIGVGAGAPMFMNIPGESSKGVYSANEFLVRLNLMKAYLFPQYDTPIKTGKRVAVLGAGNVTMDSARWALRMGAEEVHVVYRRTKAEMPARAEERENAEEEGVIFDILTNPSQILPDEQGWVQGMECVRMELGEPDESGRRRPVPIKGSEFTMEFDTVIPALGTQPNPLIPRTTPGLETTKRGTVKADDDGKTTKEGVWAGGDIVTGAATVISAMGAGKRSAASINEYLK